MKKLSLILGPPAVGKTLLAAVLDAHRQIAMAEEVQIPEKLMFHLGMLEEVIKLSCKEEIKREYAGYSYHTPNQYQGNCNEAEVWGSKTWSLSLFTLTQDPTILGQLRLKFNVPIKIIHIIRNPYNVIPELAERTKLSLRDRAGHYFNHVEAWNMLKSRLEHKEFFELTYEDLVKKKEDAMAQILNFLDVEPNPSYLAAIHPLLTPNPVPVQRDWDLMAMDFVRRRIKDYEFLESYD